MKILKNCLSLFLSFFKISAFTLGGGYVIVPLIRKEFCDKRGLISEDDMLDIIAMAQSTPGAVAVNTSALVGKRLGGAPGVIAALLGAILPPFIIISVISYFYALFINNTVVANVLLGMRAGVTAVIADAVVTMAAPFVKSKRIVSVILVAAAFAAVYFFKVNPIFVILGGIITGILEMLITRGRRKEK